LLPAADRTTSIDLLGGNQRRKIFRDDQDRLLYLERLEHYRQHYRFRVYAYVLMSNLVYLLLETGTTLEMIYGEQIYRAIEGFQLAQIEDRKVVFTKGATKV